MEPEMVSTKAPRMNRAAVKRMAKRRPLDDVIGPEARAPISPPTVYIEDTIANWASFISIHCGREVIEGGDGDVLARPTKLDSNCDREEDLLLAQVMTSCGAFSSP